MRRIGDVSPDWQVKTEMWHEICKDRHIMGLIDDRNQIIYRGRMLGLKAMQVENGLF